MKPTITNSPVQFDQLFSNSAKVYSAPLNLMASLRWDGWEATLTMQDISHAGKHGKECVRVTIVGKNSAHNAGDGIGFLTTAVRTLGGDLRKVFEAVAAMDFPTTGFDNTIRDGSVEYRRSYKKANRTFSPFAKYAPLTEVPTKWTIPHVIRALWNHQYEGLKCDSYYTDDYAGDAAVNFRAGPIDDGRLFASKLIEEPSGWWAQMTGSCVSICCHHFNSNSFTFRLTPAETATPAV